MTSPNVDICTFYYDEGITKTAITWCPECQVFLCTDCEKHHNKSEDHKTISSKEYSTLPSFMQELRSQCGDHKKKYEFYCSFHACPCCVHCVTDKHQKCQEMKPLSDILKQVKSSASVHLLDKDLKDVNEKYEEIRKYLNSRKNTNNIQKIKAIEKIQSMRRKIDDFLNKKQQQILEELEFKHSKMKSKIKMILRQLKQRANKIDHLQNEFSKITQYATELQMYIGLQEIEKTTSEATHYIEYLESGDDFDEKNIKVKISSVLKSILKDVTSFGDININHSPSSLQIKTGRQDQAQYLIPKSIEQIKPSMLRTLTIPEDKKMTNILACRIFPDGKYLVLDNQSYGSQLLLFSNDGIFLRKIAAFRGPSYDACIVRNNTVAVTLLLATNQTQLVDAEENNIIRTFKLSHACYGVVSDGQMMFISSMEKSTMVNLIDLSQTTLEEVKAHHKSLYKGNIYGTIYNENKVCCYKSTGEPLWTFMHHDIVKPQGLTLDKNGFVYIASYGNNSIVVISPENKRCKTILSEADGIMNPYEIDINSKTGMMIVASEIKKDSNSKSYQTVIIYKLEKFVRGSSETCVSPTIAAVSVKV